MAKRKGEELTLNSANSGFDLFDDDRNDDKRLNASVADASDFIVDIREWDVPYHVRVMIDQSRWSDPFSNAADSNRYTDGKMVHSRGKTRRYVHEVFRRKIGKSGSSRNGL
jgi:DNA polymerase elongation subunit (family B)